MQAIVTRQPGGWDATEICDVEPPIAAPEEAVIEIAAVGLNPADAFQVEGTYPTGPNPPFVAGRDAAGVVVTADRAGRVNVGDKVVVLQSTTTDLRRGMLSRQQAVRAENLVPLPAGWSMIEGAAAPLVYLTAWRALRESGHLAAGQVVAISGASGGVGLAAVQLASAIEAKVVALSRSPDKRERLREHGADWAFDPAEEGLRDIVRDEICRRGVDLVVDNIGGDFVETAVNLLDRGGRVALVGLLAGVQGKFSIPSLLFKQATITGVLVTDYLPSEAVDAWNGIVSALERANRRPVVHATFPFQDYAKAFQALRGDCFGKVVVDFA